MEYLPQPCAEFPNDNPALHDGAVWACASPSASPRAVVRAAAAVRWVTAQQQAHAVEPQPVVACEAAGSELVASEAPPDDTASAEVAVVEIDALVEAWAELDAPLGEALPDVLAADPFVAELWGQLDDAAHPSDAELWTDRTHDALSPAPVSEMRLFRPPSDVAEPWNRLAPLELDLSPLPPKLRDWSAYVTQISRYLLDHGATKSAALVSPLLAGERVNLRSLNEKVRRELCARGIAEEGAHDLYPTESFRREAAAFCEVILKREVNARGANDWLAELLRALVGGGVTFDAVLRDLALLGVVQDALSDAEDGSQCAGSYALAASDRA